MNKSNRLWLLAMIFLATTLPVSAQQPTNIRRIGYLGGTSAAAYAGRMEAFRQGLLSLGYVGGKNIVIEQRYAEGKPDRLRELAAELARLKVDILISPGPTVTRFLKQATSTIPIVMANEGDPVGSGFVASLARPGGNLTGLSSLAPELSGKRLELLKETLPKISRVAFVGESTNPGDSQTLRETVIAAGAIEIYLRYLDVQEAKDIEPAFKAAVKGRAEAILVSGNPVLNSQRQQVVELAAKHRLPTAYGRPEYSDAGGLMYYGTNFPELFRRAASYVDKILKDAKPAELPVEQPKKFELIINLPAAKKIGLTIPPNVLVRADKVIK